MRRIEVVIGSVKGILIATYSRKVSQVEAKKEAGDFFISNIGRISWQIM